MDVEGVATAVSANDAIRALHETVVALRTALEDSRREIKQLKSCHRRKSAVGREHKKRKVGVVVKTRLSVRKTIDLSITRRPDHHRKQKVQFAKQVMNGGGDNDETTPPTAPDDVDDLDQEVDDIELIFTTDDDTAKESDINKEHLVSIDTDCYASQPINDQELEDDVFNPTVTASESKSDNSINNPENKSLKSCYSSYQDSSFENRSLEKDESFDRFEETVRIVETDISKCGIQEVEYGGLRRNTCPNPLQYRPIIHRDVFGKSGSKKGPRPILGQSTAARKQSGVQTDITALPGSSWLSESNLANTKVKTGEYPTLPSKFPLPGSRLRLSEKTVEARRVLLSDIGFTSMVPELSRSADHLFQTNQMKATPAPVSYGQFLRASDYQSPAYTSQRFTWATTTATPSDCGSCNQSRYNSFYPMVSPPVPGRRCSAPVSPSRKAFLRGNQSKVRFANGSLPELRSGDWTLDSDSTDSLVEEAENYLRRSIDCLIRDGRSGGKVPRRASAPEPSNDNVPPQGWQPFLPRVPRDLKPDHWIKVITSEGRVRGGRVRYIGPVQSQSEYFIGVQLATPEGLTDGTYNSRRYFQCEPNHGIFVPFKKVIMGWRP